MALSIGLFNYCIDPFVIFHPNIYKKHASYDSPQSLIKTTIRSYKNFKYQNFMIGSSDAQLLLGDSSVNMDKVFILAVPTLKMEQRVEFLKYYIKMHPETKFVFLPLAHDIGLPASAENYIETLPTGYFGGYSIKELFFLLLSSQSTNESIKILKNQALPKFKQEFYNLKRIGFKYRNTFIHNIMNDDTKQTIHFYASDFDCYPRRINIMSICDDMIPEHFEIQKVYIKDMLDFLKENNVSYAIVIPPFHALHASIFYSNEKYYSVIEDFKRFLVENANTVYDFNFVNKYTSTNLYQNNKLYLDLKHISPLLGIKIYKYFFDKNNREEDICIVLTKDNIEEMLKYEKSLLQEYINTHKELVNEYVNIYKEQKKSDFVYKYTIRNIPCNFDPNWNFNHPRYK